MFIGDGILVCVSRGVVFQTPQIKLRLRDPLKFSVILNCVKTTNEHVIESY